MAFPSLPMKGVFTSSLDEGVTLPYLDERDVGKLCVKAFEGVAGGFEVASEDLTPEQVVDILRRVSGVEIGFKRRSAGEIEATQMTEIFQGFEMVANRMPKKFGAEIIEREFGIKLNSLEEYLTEHTEELIKSLPPFSVSSL